MHSYVVWAHIKFSLKNDIQHGTFFKRLYQMLIELSGDLWDVYNQQQKNAKSKDLVKIPIQCDKITLGETEMNWKEMSKSYVTSKKKKKKILLLYSLFSKVYTNFIFKAMIFFLNLAIYSNVKITKN